ncbi:MAG TPA: YfhO family protein [Planctomycetota bacterium]|nr:YfhO family protein [Planctomycetota bacterium]
MKRAAPYLLFAAVTLAIFWKFLAFGHTMYAMPALEAQLGRPTQEPRGWFRSAFRHTRVSDNLTLLALHLRIYNAGLHANELRLWNPSLFCGLPTTADPMVHPFYPPNLLLHRVFGPDVAYELGALLHLFFSGVAMHLLLRCTGRSSMAAAGGGLIWMLGGYQAMWFSTSILAGLSVFGPLALALLLTGVAARNLARATFAGVLMGIAVLGSHPQHAILFFLMLVAWSVVSLRRQRADLRFSVRFLFLFAVFTVGVGMVEILARLDSIENGYRDPAFDHLSLYSEPWRLATYAGGLILGKVYFPGPGWEAEFPVFLGLAGAGLAVIGALRRRQDTDVRVAATAALVSLAAAFAFPLAWIFLQIPLLNLSPASRCLVLTGFCLSFLAGQGIDELLASPGTAWRSVAWVAVAFLFAALWGAGPVRLSNGAAVETLIGFGLAAGAWFWVGRSRPLGAGLGLAALLFELLPPFLQANYHADSSLLAKTPESLSRARDGWRTTGLLGTTAVSTRSEQWGNDLVTGNNLIALYGAENIGGFEALIPRPYVAFAEAARASVSPAGRTLQFTRLDSPLIDFTGLRYVLLPPSLSLPLRFRKLGDFGSVALFENPAALPRARLASKIRAARTAEEAEVLLRDPQVDLKWETIVETDRSLPVTYEGDVTWKRRGGDSSELEVTVKSPALLIVAETDYPGWQATVDGRPTPILKANLAFRAVEIPAGTHRVEFGFHPWFARAGSLASLLFLILAPVAARRWRAA